MAFTQLWQCPKRINDRHRNSLFVRCTATQLVISANDTAALGIYEGTSKNMSEANLSPEEETKISPSVKIISQEFQSLAIKLDGEIMGQHIVVTRLEHQGSSNKPPELGDNSAFPNLHQTGNIEQGKRLQS